MEMDPGHKSHWHTPKVWAVDERLAAHLERLERAAASLEGHLPSETVRVEYPRVKGARRYLATARAVLTGQPVTREQIMLAGQWGWYRPVHTPQQAAESVVFALGSAVMGAVLNPDREIGRADESERAVAGVVADAA